MITKAQQRALQGALKFASTGDLVDWMNARYRRLAAGGDGRFRGHEADFVRRLSPADDFLINLALVGSEDQIALLAARSYIRYLESAKGQAIKPFIAFAGETSFLNVMIADPVTASTNLRSRLHAAWGNRSTAAGDAYNSAYLKGATDHGAIK